MKTRPCRRAMYVGPGKALGDCPYPAMKGKQTCVWHWLMRQSADVQRQAAEFRLTGLEVAHRARVPATEWPRGERWCAGCQSFVPLFYTSGSRCKSCASSAAHASRVQKTYDITPERYDELLRQQGGRCAICKNKPRTMRLAVDHDHKTGAPRGLLCKRCNHDLLGGGHDDPMMMWTALAYLLCPPASYPERPTDAQVWYAYQERKTAALIEAAPPVDDTPPPF